jgi:hypothetical protein
MSVRISGSCLGVPLTFDVDDALAPRFTALLPHGWQDGTADEDARSWSVSTAFDLVGVLNDAELHVAEQVAGFIAIHAGAVAFDDRAILIPGRSLSGKSTLTEALVRRGGTYYSDEFALLDDAGRVHPYARPLTMRATQSEPARSIEPQTLQAVGERPVPVALVAYVHYRPDASWDVVDVSPGEGTLALIDNAVAAQTRSDEVLRHCAAAARQAKFVRGVRGEAPDAVDEVLRLLEPA